MNEWMNKYTAFWMAAYSLSKCSWFIWSVYLTIIQCLKPLRSDKKTFTLKKLLHGSVLTPLWPWSKVKVARKGVWPGKSSIKYDHNAKFDIYRIHSVLENRATVHSLEITDTRRHTETHTYPQTHRHTQTHTDAHILVLTSTQRGAHIPVLT